MWRRIGLRGQGSGDRGKTRLRGSYAAASGDCPRTKFKKQNWCGICAHSELEKLWKESEAKTEQFNHLTLYQVGYASH